MLITPVADGKCAIEASFGLSNVRARITARNFNLATNGIIKKCVDGHDHTGGVAVNVGMLEEIQCKCTT